MYSIATHTHPLNYEWYRQKKVWTKDYRSYNMGNWFTTDGSATNQKVGAAVVAATKAFTLQLFVGTTALDTVY